LVVDASVVVSLLVSPDERASGLLRPPLRAPHLIDVEVVHALRRLARSRVIGPAAAAAAVAALPGLPLARYPHVRLLDAIWALRDTVSAYDAAYVALAQAFAEPLLTTDAPLARAARRYVDVELA